MTICRHGVLTAFLVVYLTAAAVKQTTASTRLSTDNNFDVTELGRELTNKNNDALGVQPTPKQIQLKFRVNGQLVELNLTRTGNNDNQNADNVTVLIGERGRISRWQTLNSSQSDYAVYEDAVKRASFVRVANRRDSSANVYITYMPGTVQRTYCQLTGGATRLLVLSQLAFTLLLTSFSVLSGRLTLTQIRNRHKASRFHRGNTFPMH